MKIYKFYAFLVDSTENNKMYCAIMVVIYKVRYFADIGWEVNPTEKYDKKDDFFSDSY